MRKLLIALLMLCACACNVQALRFSEPVFDTTQLPNASTTCLMHFDGDYTDLGGGTWQDGIKAWSDLASDSFKFGSHSLHNKTEFNTTSPYLFMSSGTEAFNCVLSDFTLEFWAGINMISASNSSYHTLLIALERSASSAYFYTYINHSGSSYRAGLRYVDPQIGAHSAIYSTSYSDGVISWFHCCFERRSGTLYAFINGVELFNTSMPFALAGVTGAYISTFNDPSLNANFYLDEFRFYKNGYVYGGEFTPPTRPIGLEKSMRIGISDGEIKF